jgi:hypothetical protein
METQSYAQHARIVPLYHRVLLPLTGLIFLGSLVNLYRSLGDHSRLYNAALITALTLTVQTLAIFSRVFALKAQDRAIRAEENLRHFVMAGKLLDSRLSMKQIVALRFASDGEFVELARRAAEQSLAPDAIKQSIKTWRSDYNRL